MSDCENCPSKDSCGKDAKDCGITNNPKNNIKNIIGVMSGKGGVGKSSITVLLAKMLKNMGYKVGIMDADITGPSIPRMFGVEKEKAVGQNDMILPIMSEEGIKLMSINFLIETEETPVIWRGPIIANSLKQFYNEVLWEELDYLFIDMPPGTGDVAITLMQTIPLNGVVMVSTPQDMVSMIVSKAINMAKKMNINIYGLIENMAYISCPDCGKRIQIFNASNTTEFINKNSIELLAELPMIQDLSNLANYDKLDDIHKAVIKSMIDPAVEKLIQKTKH
ncbi:MAG: Mrp/NBP35 family ATP-binding protein [Erysipelotrichaceae bacterium]